MKMIRKIGLITVGTLLLAALFMSCSNAGSTSQTGLASNDDAKKGKLQEIQERGVLRVAIILDTVPLGIIDSSGEAVGYDVDWSKELARILEVDLELVEVTGETRLPTITSNRADVLIAGITGNLARSQIIDFTIPYIKTGIKIMLPAGSQYNEIEDLNDPNLTVSVVRGTTNESLVMEYAPLAKVLTVDGGAEQFLLVEQGKADATFSDGTVVDYYVSQSNGKLETRPRIYTSEPLCLGVAKGDPDFLRFLDMFVSWKISEGWQAETYEKWWGEAPAPLVAIW